MQEIKIEYTETFNNSTDLTIAHYSQWSGEYEVIEKIEDTVDIYERKVSSNPFIYPVSQSLLAEVGLSSVREANINGYRLLYEVNEQGDETIITSLLLLGQRQSVKEQLIQHCLMYR